MDYIDYDMNGFDLHVIKTDRFKTISYNINIRFDDEKDSCISGGSHAAGPLRLLRRRHATDRRLSDGADGFFRCRSGGGHTWRS